MSKIDGSALMFDEEQVRTTRSPLPRLIRIIFYGLSITNNEYISRYQRFIRSTSGGRSTRESNQKLGSDRKFLQDKHNLTYKLMNSVLIAMGLDIECISVRVRDRITDEVKTFSTDDTVDSLKADLEKEKVIGIQNLFGSSDADHKNPVATSESVERNSFFTVVMIVKDDDKEPCGDIGRIGETKEDALSLLLDDAIELSDRVEETRLVVDNLKTVPIGTPVVGQFSGDLYMVVEVPKVKQ